MFSKRGGSVQKRERFTKGRDKSGEYIENRKDNVYKGFILVKHCRKNLPCSSSIYPHPPPLLFLLFLSSFLFSFFSQPPTHPFSSPRLISQNSLLIVCVMPWHDTISRTSPQDSSLNNTSIRPRNSNPAPPGQETAPGPCLLLFPGNRTRFSPLQVECDVEKGLEPSRK